jgi:hypothetical protein
MATEAGRLKSAKNASLEIREEVIDFANRRTIIGSRARAAQVTANARGLMIPSAVLVRADRRVQ